MTTVSEVSEFMDKLRYRGVSRIECSRCQIKTLHRLMARLRFEMCYEFEVDPDIFSEVVSADSAIGNRAEKTFQQLKKTAEKLFPLTN